MEIRKIYRQDYKGTFLEILNEYKNVPEFINFSGDILRFQRNEYKFLLVVGSRRHSKEAKLILEKLFSGLKNQKIVIVSGLARGIDSLAHELAIKNNLPTIAIPGSGLNDEVLYPKANFGLAKDIVNKGGLLLSEFENNFQATPWSFPKRNELMVKISDMVLVVEAGKKSGTLITARLSLDFNKDLAVVPGSILSDFYLGSNNLLKDGAFPILDSNDILDLLAIDVVEQKVLEFNDLDEVESLILKKIAEPKTKTEIAIETNLDLSKINIKLSSLEIKGYVILRNGLIYKK